MINVTLFKQGLHMQYDGKGKLAEAIADLYGLSPKSVAQIAAHIKKSKDALGMATKAKILPEDDRLKIYQWHWERLNPAQGAEQQPTLNGTGAADGLSPPEQPPEIENSLTVAIDPEPMPDTPKPQPGGNWGGTRPNAGRKPGGKQTAVIRVNVELVELFRRLDVLHSQGVDVAKRVEPLL